jgi:hypothetical protein
MALHSSRWTGVLAMIATLGLGCAEGASENANVPPLDGVDTGSNEDASSADSGANTDSTVTDSGTSDTTGTGDSGLGDVACDPGKGLTISCGVGECTVTVPACTETGMPNTCKPKDPGVETCNGKDDDCDGLVDEELGETECGVGECKVIQKNCVDGAPKTCTPKPKGTEVCNGKDDDCDGTVDNGFPSTTCGVGECKVTVSACSGGMVGTCTPKPSSTEVCNGKDDDCDGTVDNGIKAITCGTGICANTVPGCVDGAVPACVPKDLGIEACGIGECYNVITKCVAGVPQTCAPKTGSAEKCNGKDDNCDGTIDNGDPAVMCPAPAGVGATECLGGVCKIKDCAAGFHDVDGNLANGCECADVGPAHLCPGTDLLTVAPGTSFTKTYNNPVRGREDWFKITFLQALSNKAAHPRVELTMEAGFTGPVPFEIKVFQQTCGSGAVPSCADSPALPWERWERWYEGTVGSYGDQPGNTEWLPILLPQKTTQTDAVVYVRVTYKGTATTATCAKYTLTIGN